MQGRCRAAPDAPVPRPSARRRWRTACISRGAPLGSGAFALGVSMKVGLFGAAPLVLCLSAASASAQQAIATPILTSVNNFRDIAGISAADGGTGTADTTGNNGVMRTGVFYRSNVLTLSSADLATISTLRITEVIDLRTPSEIAATPDVVPAGAGYLNVNILGTI